MVCVVSCFQGNIVDFYKVNKVDIKTLAVKSLLFLDPSIYTVSPKSTPNDRSLFPFLKRRKMGPRERAWWLRAPTASAEEPGLVPSTHVSTHNTF